MANHPLKRVLAIVLALIMCVGMLNITALAIPVVEEVPETHMKACPDCTDGKVDCAACNGIGKTECTGTYIAQEDDSETKATCYHLGDVVYVCDECGSRIVLKNNVLDHEKLWEKTVIEAATCTETGTMQIVCPKCKEEWTKTIPVLGHEYGEDGSCIHDGCSETAFSVGATFKVDDCWEKDSNQGKFDNYSLTCTVLTAPENGENGTVAVTGWSGAEGNTSRTGIYILIPPTVEDDFGNTYTVTEVTANFQMNQSNQKKGKLLGFYLRAPVKELSVNNMFANQTNLQILQLPDTLEVIGTGCFSGCKYIDNISPVVLPESLKEIGISAFKGVPFIGKNEKTLDIPESVTYIGTLAFEKSNLKTVTGGEGITKLEGNVFQNCWRLKSVDFPNVTEFESSVFYGDSALTNVGWDWSKVTYIDESAFDGCSGLSGPLVLSGDCELDGMYIFYNTGFESVTIGEGMTEIPEGTFYKCFNLTEVNLPNSLTTIGQKAFAQSGDGEEITVTIGSDDASRLSEVKSGAFADGNFNITVHTSEDSISNTAYLEGNGNTVTYKVASIKTTKTAADLQTLINEAESGATIDLTESYDINAKVTVPEGKSVTLTSSNGSVLKGTVSGYMFDVPATAGLALGEGLTAMVRNTRLVESAGTFTLAGADVTGGSAGMNQGVVHITEGGVFIMNSGSISGAYVTDQYAGTVLLSEGAEMTMTGGTISKNNAEGLLNSGAGVTVCQGASFTMNGGEISGNKAFRGAGVLVFGGTESSETYSKDPAVFTMNDGKITGNTASGYSGNSRAAGGGVYVQNNAQFTMNGGEISGNVSNHQGGGVATQDENGTGGVFTMNGGTISGNKAVNGGGVYSYSKAVKLLGGRIEYNEASGLGGGMYVSTDPYSIQLGDALITGNTATVMGGGIWSCPIGTIDFADGHFAIYENTAGGAGNDVAALSKKTNTITTLGDNMPGGGVMAWYQDGGIYSASLDGNDFGSVSKDVPRYAEGDIRIEAPIKSEKSFSAKSIVTDDAASLVSTSLIIRGNKASQGGGIGSNGIVTLPGDPVETDDLTVTKVWSGSGDHPDSVTVELTATKDGKTIVLDRAVLSEDNNWTYTFKYVPLEGMVYGVQEIVPEGYESTVSTDEDTGAVTITNTKKSPPDDDTDDPDVPPDDDEDIDDPDVPTDDGEDIDDPDVPLDDGEDIDDPDVPLGELPHTGTTPFSANKAAAVMMILAAVLTLSGAAAAFAGRRKEQ